MTTDTPSAEALAATLDAMAGPMRGNGENPEFDAIFEPRAKALEDAAAVLRTLSADNANLRTVMVAAAEEIHAHWEAHCDAEGYGPANLMHRLEQGIPAQYGYTAGRFAELVAERDALRNDFAALQHALVGNTGASAIERAASLVAERAEADKIIGSLQAQFTACYSSLLSVEKDRDALRAALDAEREACAKLCEEIGDRYQAREAYKWAEMKTDAQTGAQDCATAIRARTTPPQQEPTA